MYFLDTETCGLHGICILIQYAKDDEEVQLHDVWLSPITETILLIKKFTTEPIVGFNLAFDWFHICKLYTILIKCKDMTKTPLECLDEIKEIEMDARDGPCVKPHSACDLFLHARKGPYQSTMERKDIRIKRVPTVLAQPLADELTRRIPIKDIYFARRKDKTRPRWEIEDVEDSDGVYDRNFKNIVLKFQASSALKVLAVDALGVNPNDVLLYADAEAGDYPEEVGYAPYWKAVGANGWPSKVQKHIDHWAYRDIPRAYAKKDVELTRDLWKFFGRPEPGDDDSELACSVAACRWRGFKINIDKIKTLRTKAVERSAMAPKDPARVKEFLFKHLSPEEIVVIKGSTSKVVLEEIATQKDLCEACDGDGCDKCDHGYIHTPGSRAAQMVIDARSAAKEVELYDKLIKAGRFHASFKVIGALSGRMSGADDLNPQGIKRSTEVRECFLIANEGDQLDGGDFDAFEVVLALAAYPDKKLEAAVKSKKKIHALFAVLMFPGETYDGIMESKGTDDDMYTDGKVGVFTMIYGGDFHTLARKQGIPMDIAERAFNEWFREYPDMSKEQAKIAESLQSMKQPGGLGTKVYWDEPADKIETLFGFPRYFTLENMICKALFNLAENPPKDWLQFKVKVTRRDREQTASGAVRSALFGAAFGIQSANVRAGINHRIQGSGSQVTKRVQRRIWDLQPAGIYPWRVQPMNIHDEILSSTNPQYSDKVKEIVYETVESYRSRVPLIKLEWQQKMGSWADK